MTHSHRENFQEIVSLSWMALGQEQGNNDISADAETVRFFSKDVPARTPPRKSNEPPPPPKRQTKKPFSPEQPAEPSPPLPTRQKEKPISPAPEQPVVESKIEETPSPSQTRRMEKLLPRPSACIGDTTAVRKQILSKAASSGFSDTPLYNDPPKKSGPKQWTIFTYLVPKTPHETFARSVVKAIGERLPVRVAEQLAREACEIEIDIVGKPIGVQDQYIAAYGGLRYFQFGPGPGVKVNSVKASRATLEDLDNMLMLFFTGKTRESAKILAEQKSNIRKKTNVLKAMARQAEQVRRAISTGAIDSLGPLLHEAWEAKRKLAGTITNSQLDEIYERALKAGALGGKISGAGGGGFFLLCVPSDKRQSVRKALADLREMPFRLEKGGSRVVLDMQRY